MSWFEDPKLCLEPEKDQISDSKLILKWNNTLKPKLSMESLKP